MAELVDALDLKSSGLISRAGSIPARGTILRSVFIGASNGTVSKSSFFVGTKNKNLVNSYYFLKHVFRVFFV